MEWKGSHSAQSEGCLRPAPKLGFIYQGRGNLDGAIAEWKEALRNKPGPPQDARFLPGVGVHSAAGKLDEAATVWKEALRTPNPRRTSSARSVALGAVCHQEAGEAGRGRSRSTRRPSSSGPE